MNFIIHVEIYIYRKRRIFLISSDNEIIRYLSLVNIFMQCNFLFSTVLSTMTAGINRLNLNKPYRVLPVLLIEFCFPFKTLTNNNVAL